MYTGVNAPERGELVLLVLLSVATHSLASTSQLQGQFGVSCEADGLGAVVITVCDLVRWVAGLDTLVGLIAAGSAGLSHAGGGWGRICGGCWRAWSARTGGPWPITPVRGARTGWKRLLRTASWDEAYGGES